MRAILRSNGKLACKLVSNAWKLSSLSRFLSCQDSLASTSHLLYVMKLPQSNGFCDGHGPVEMVNRKPSTGCAACRERHIKCDEGKPGCQRCEMRGMPCPGYRDVRGIIFVNNSRKITERHIKRINKEVVKPRSPSPPPAALDLSESYAVGFFFSRYAETIGNGSGSTRSRGHLDFLVPMFVISSADSPLALSTVALAYQALNVHHNDAYRQQCNIAAMRACKQLQSAVADKKEAQKDETLMAVLCMDFAAHLVLKDSLEPANRVHTDGALALVQQRPTESFQSAVSQSLYAATRSNVLLHSLWFGDEKAARSIMGLPKIDIGKINPIVDIQSVLARALTLDHEIIAAPMQDREERADTVKILEKEADAWFSNLPTSWKQLYVQPTRYLSQSLVHQAYTLGLWHCVKVLLLKLQCATFDEVENVAARMDDQLVSLRSFCQYLEQPFEDQRTAVMDRGRSSVVYVAKGGPLIYSGAITDAENYRLDLIRWIVDELTSEYPACHGFFTSQGKMTAYFEDELAKLLSGMQVP